MIEKVTPVQEALNRFYKNIRDNLELSSRPPFIFNERKKHQWFYFKNDTFRSCKKCGGIENPKITDGICQGVVKIKFRK